MVIFGRISGIMVRFWVLPKIIALVILTFSSNPLSVRIKDCLCTALHTCYALDNFRRFNILYIIRIYHV